MKPVLLAKKALSRGKLLEEPKPWLRRPIEDVLRRVADGKEVDMAISAVAISRRIDAAVLKTAVHHILDLEKKDLDGDNTGAPEATKATVASPAPVADTLTEPMFNKDFTMFEINGCGFAGAREGSAFLSCMSRIRKQHPDFGRSVADARIPSFAHFKEINAAVTSLDNCKGFTAAQWAAAYGFTNPTIFTQIMDAMTGGSVSAAADRFFKDFPMLRNGVPDGANEGAEDANVKKKVESNKADQGKTHTPGQDSGDIRKDLLALRYDHNVMKLGEEEYHCIRPADIQALLEKAAGIAEVALAKVAAEKDEAIREATAAAQSASRSDGPMAMVEKVVVERTSESCVVGLFFSVGQGSATGEWDNLLGRTVECCKKPVSC